MFLPSTNTELLFSIVSWTLNFWVFMILSIAGFCTYQLYVLSCVIISSIQPVFASLSYCTSEIAVPEYGVSCLGTTSFATPSSLGNPICFWSILTSSFDEASFFVTALSFSSSAIANWKDNAKSLYCDAKILTKVLKSMILNWSLFV